LNSDSNANTVKMKKLKDLIGGKKEISLSLTSQNGLFAFANENLQLLSSTSVIECPRTFI